MRKQVELRTVSLVLALLGVLKVAWGDDPVAALIAGAALILVLFWVVSRSFWRPFEITFEVRRPLDLWSQHEEFRADADQEALAIGLAQLSPHFLTASLLNRSGQPLGQPRAIVDLGTTQYAPGRINENSGDSYWIDLVIAIAINPSPGSAPTWLQIEPGNFPPDWRELDWSSALQQLPGFFPAKKPQSLLEKIIAQERNLAIGQQAEAYLKLSGHEFRQSKRLFLGFDSQGVPFVECRRRWFSRKSRLSPAPDPPSGIERHGPGLPPKSVNIDPQDQLRSTDDP